MSEQDTSRLLREATHDLHDLTSDVDTLVRGGIARGRARRRRRRAGTALAAAAVVGVTGVAASVLPGALDDDSSADVGFAARPTSAPAPASTSEATPTPGPPGVSLITVPARDVPAVFGEVLGGDVGETRTDDGFPLIDERQHKIVHFTYDGTLATFTIERADSLASCAELVDPADQPDGEPGGTCEVRDGVEVLVWGPEANDGVTAQGVSAWTRGYVVSALSYNAADGKDVPPVTDVPPISIDELVGLTTSDVWFAEPASGS